MSKPKVTGKGASRAASKTLRSSSTGTRTKRSSGSALSQTGTPKRVSSAKAASAASRVLRDGRTSATSKSAAGSTLSQRPGPGGGRKK